MTEVPAEVYRQRLSGLKGLLAQAQGIARLITWGEYEPHTMVYAVDNVLTDALRWTDTALEDSKEKQQ